MSTRPNDFDDIVPEGFMEDVGSKPFHIGHGKMTVVLNAAGTYNLLRLMRDNGWTVTKEQRS